MRWQLLPLMVALLQTALAAVGAEDPMIEADPAPASAGTGTSTKTSQGIVPFLQTMQAAEIASMSCLITLVNMTQTPIGSCLGISRLAPLLINTNRTTDFSRSLNTYLDGVCRGTGCTESQIADARTQLGQTCQGQNGKGLVPAIDALLAGYMSSYKTLACSIYFNGTANNCVTQVISSNQAANNPQFFMDLLSGNNLNQYADQVFKAAQCTGCMHELYKAAVFLLPGIRNQGLTNDLGYHLKDDCGTGPLPNWPSVMDQQIPNALTVQQSRNTGGGRSSGASPRMGHVGAVRARYGRIGALGVAIIVGRGWRQ